MKSIEYTEDEMLPLSGIQHYAYCPRQWALIHIEQLWAENHLTMEGHFLHNNVDNPFLRESNGSNVLTLRGLRLSSPTIGLNGVSDAVELHPIGEGNVNKDDMLISMINTRQISKSDFLKHGEDSNLSVLFTEKGLKIFLTAWQNKKKTEIMHPFLNEKVPIGLLPFIQARLLSRYFRRDMDDYPVFVMK